MLARSLPLLLLLLAPLGALAQDSVRLLDGKRIRGEVREETDLVVVVITELGELRKIPRKQVEEVKRGRPLGAAARKRLEGVDHQDADALLEVVRWANEAKSRRRDAKILARRLLVLDPEDEVARKILGHVKYQGVWYPDSKSAGKAIADFMKSEGRVKYKKGWALKDDLKEIKATPGKWMVWKHRWRLARELMIEQGKTDWNGQWYDREEKPLINELEIIKRKLGSTAHGARVGKCEVYSMEGRGDARKHAKHLDATRRWFEITFDAAGDKHVADPVSRTYVLRNHNQFREWADEFRRRHENEGELLGFFMKQGMMNFKPLSLAIHAERTDWRHSIVSQMGKALMARRWQGGFRIADWIRLACARHAQIVVLKEARSTFVAPDKYGREEKERTEGGVHIAEAKKQLADAYDAGKVPSVRDLFGVRTNAMDERHDMLGLVLMVYLLEGKTDAWRKYLSEPKAGNPEERFRKFMDGSYEDVEEEFKEWLDV